MKDLVAAVETFSNNFKMKTSMNKLLSKVALITNSRGQQYPIAASSLPNPKRNSGMLLQSQFCTVL